MKKYLTIQFLLVTLMLSCTNGDILTADYHESVINSCTSYKRNYEDALAIAQDAMAIVDQTSNTRTVSGKREIDFSKGVIGICSKENATRAEAQDTLLYVFNFANNEGFAVVSASKRTEGLIAVAEQGYYSDYVNSDSSNIGFKQYMEAAKQYVANSMAVERVQTRAVSKYWKMVSDTLEYEKILPKVHVKWGQESFMGRFCPNGITGCGPLAAFQIMTYFRYPISMSFSFPERTIKYNILPWSGINQHIGMIGHPTALCPIAGKSRLDTIMGHIARELGHRSRSNYGAIDTGTDPNRLISVLKGLGYKSSGIKHYSSSTNLLEEIKSGKLALMCGEDYDDSDKKHGWVVDGGFHMKVHIYSYTSEDAVSWTLNWDEIYDLDYHHVNWGFYGEYNGYYLDVWPRNTAYNSLDDPNETCYTPNFDFSKNLRYATIWR